MMEEIDRFQVPTAHSEMQPLVRGRAAGRPGPGGGAAGGGGRESSLGDRADASDGVESQENASSGGGGLVGRENRGRICGMTAKRPVRAERQAEGATGIAVDWNGAGAQWCTTLVEARSGERKGTVTGHRRWQAQGRGREEGGV